MSEKRIGRFAGWASALLIFVACSATPPCPPPKKTEDCPKPAALRKELEALEADGRLETALAKLRKVDAERCPRAHAEAKAIANSIAAELDAPRAAFVELDKAMAAKARGDSAKARRLFARSRFALRREAGQQERLIGIRLTKGVWESRSREATPSGLIPARGEDLVARKTRTALFVDRCRAAATPLLVAPGSDLSYLPSGRIVTGPPWRLHSLEPLGAVPHVKRSTKVLQDLRLAFRSRRREDTCSVEGLGVQSWPLPGKGRVVGFADGRVLRQHDGKLSMYTENGDLVAEREVSRDETLTLVRRHGFVYELDASPARTVYVSAKSLDAWLSTSSLTVPSVDGRFLAEFSRPKNPRVTVHDFVGHRLVDSVAPKGTSPHFRVGELSLHKDRWLVDARVEGRLSILDISSGAWRVVKLPPPVPVQGVSQRRRRRAALEFTGKQICLSGGVSKDVVDAATGKVSRLRGEHCVFGRDEALIMKLPVRAGATLWPVSWSDTAWEASALFSETTVAFVELDAEHNRPVLVLTNNVDRKVNHRIPLLPSNENAAPLLDTGVEPIVIYALDHDHVVLHTFVGDHMMMYVDVKTGEIHDVVRDSPRGGAGFAQLMAERGTRGRAPDVVRLAGDKMMFLTAHGTANHEHEIWNLKTGTHWGFEGPNCDSAISDNGSFAVVASNCLPYQTLAQVYRLDGSEPQPHHTAIDVRGARRVFAVSDDGSSVVMGHGRIVEVHDTASGNLRASFGGRPSSVAISHDATWVATSERGTTELWKKAEAGYVRQWTTTTRSMKGHQLRFVDGGRYIAHGDRVLDARSGHQVVFARRPGGQVALRWLERTNATSKLHGRKPIAMRSMTRLPDAGLVMLATSDHRVEVLDERTGKSVATVSLEPGGQLLAFLEGGYVDVLNPSSTGTSHLPKSLLCDFGAFATEADVCAERWLVTGGLGDVMRGHRSYQQLWE